VAVEAAIVGGGPERAALERQAAELGLERTVRFVGPLSFDHAITWHAWAHCLVLPSKHSEGWPKVVAEGMCHGVLCIAVAHGQLPTMLEGRGLLLETGAPEEIAAALAGVAAQPEAFAPMMQRAGCWARQFSLEGLRDALAVLLTERWERSPASARSIVET
jgi:glycosyltransferase involved in cell wall biosynthesis